MELRDIFKEYKDIPEFEEMITDPELAMTAQMDVLQVNVGYKCNLACKHCHVKGGPNRTEVMSREVMEDCLKAYKSQGCSTIDITGGAPEMNPNFRWFIDECTKICDHVMVRTNLVILLEEEYKDLPEFYRDHKVELVCSLPYYRAGHADRQRGKGSFDKSIQVIQHLNELGYGRDPELVLDMVYNPGGAYFPPEQTAMEREYKARLGNDYGITFNHLFAIANNPIGRFGEFLVRSDNMETYLGKLCEAFNPATLPGMMCRSQISVGWDGKVYDCDFNQALGMEISTGETIADLAEKPYQKRKICFDKHCYACTAGQGSSCGGSTE